MKIGIMGAMVEEVAHLKDSMDSITEHSIGKRIYYEGKIGPHDVVLVFSRWGKVASSSTATTLINQFDVHSIIFTGVAGAVSEKLNIGDIVIGNTLCQHDMDARPIFKRYQIPLTDRAFFSIHAKEIEEAYCAAKQFTSEIANHINQMVLNEFTIIDPKVYVGAIASGDQFVTDSNIHQSIQCIEDQEILAVEMEGAAVAQVCFEHNTPFTIIRVISDKAKEDAHIDFQSFIKKIASHYSYGIISYMLNSNIQHNINYP